MTLADWRNVSIVLLALPASVFGLVLVLLVYQSIRGTNWLIRRVKLYGPEVQSRFRAVANSSEKASQQIASPFIAAGAAAAKARRLLSFLCPSARGREKT